MFLEQLATSAVLPVVQRCASLIPNSVESVKIVCVVLIERILIKYQKRGFAHDRSSIEKNEIPCSDLEQVIFPLAEYLLDIKLPIKQTDHYFIRLFLRIILFMNTQVVILTSCSLDSSLQYHHSPAIGFSSFNDLLFCFESSLHPLFIRISCCIHSNQQF